VSDYDRLLDAVQDYEANEAANAKTTEWFLGRLAVIEELGNTWLSDGEHRLKELQGDQGTLNRAKAIRHLLSQVSREKSLLGTTQPLLGATALGKLEKTTNPTGGLELGAEPKHLEEVAPSRANLPLDRPATLAVEDLYALYQKTHGPERVETDLETYEILVSGRKGLQLVIEFMVQARSFDNLDPPIELEEMVARSQVSTAPRPEMPPEVAKLHVFDNEGVLRRHGFELIGYRGTTADYLKVIRKEGFTDSASSKGVNALKRGPGVYVARDRIDTARDYAKSSAAKFKSTPVVLAVYAQKAWLLGAEKPMSEYGYGQEREAKIRKWDNLYDYVYGDIESRHDQGGEVKFSPKAAHALKAVIVEM